MKRGLYSPACCALSLAIAAGASCGLAMVTSPKDTFAPYQVIIDRAIFGKPPPAKVAPVAAPVPDPTQKQAEALAKKITLKAVNRTPSGNTAVGLVDNDAKPPRILYLNVGDTVDGYTILAADNDAETATIEKDGIVISLQLGAGLVVAATPPAAAPVERPQIGRVDRGSAALELHTEQPKREPALTTVTEQLIAMELSIPPGIVAPPLPMAAVTEAQAQHALDKTITITNDDDDEIAARKVDVGWAKNDMRQHIADGGSAQSYLEGLRERRAADAARKRTARAEAEAKIVELAKELNARELEKQRAIINQWLIDNDVEPLKAEEGTEE
jgi:hypothetical protein